MQNQDKKNLEYEQLKGEYLSRMASTEYTLTILIAEMLDVSHHREEFQKWLVRTPIPFSCKADLFVSLVKEDTQLDQFRTLITSLRSLNNFRSTLAHSFSSFSGMQTSRGEIIPSEKISLNTLKSRLGQLRGAEKLLTELLSCIMEGAIPPFSADDFADGPL